MSLTHTAPLSLPHRAAGPSHTRLWGTLLIVGAFAIPPVVVLLLADDWFQRVVCAIVGLEALIAGVARSRPSLSVTTDRLEIVGTLRRHVVPWASLDSVGQEGPRLVIGWAPDGFVAVGPFEPPTGEGCEDYAQRLGAQVLALRDHARSSAASTSQASVSTQAGALWPFVICYAALMGAVGMWLVRG